MPKRSEEAKRLINIYYRYLNAAGNSSRNFENYVAGTEKDSYLFKDVPSLAQGFERVANVYLSQLREAKEFVDDWGNLLSDPENSSVSAEVLDAGCDYKKMLDLHLVSMKRVLEVKKKYAQYFPTDRPLAKLVEVEDNLRNPKTEKSESKKGLLSKLAFWR